MIGVHQRIGHLLDEVAQEKGVLGVALISRDGLAVKATGRQEMGRETFSAMTATLMGAAEIALSDLAGEKAKTVIATTDRLTLVIVGVSRDLLLVASAQADVPIPKVVSRLEEAAKAVAAAVGG